MSIKVKIDFHRLTMPARAGISFEGLLRQVSRSPNDSSRNRTLNDAPVRLRRAEESADYWEADMTKIRMDGMPVKAKLSGRIAPMKFAPDEGVGEETAFLYAPRTRCLVYQRHRSGVSLAAFARYFQLLGELDEPISLEPILETDAMRRLDRFQIVRTFNVKVAPLGKATGLGQGQNRGVSSMIDLLEEVDAPQASVSLSMGRLRGSLSVPNVVKMAKALLISLSARPDGAGQEVGKIEIAGKDLDGETDVIDLIEFRMQEVLPVESDENRRLSYKRRRVAIREAWNKRRDELNKRYGGGVSP